MHCDLVQKDRLLPAFGVDGVRLHAEYRIDKVSLVKLFNFIRSYEDLNCNSRN